MLLSDRDIKKQIESGRVGVDLEIKTIPGEPSFDSPREAILEATLRRLEVASFSGEIMISSFNWMSIERSRELAPEIPTGFLTIAAMDPRAALAYARGAGHAWVLPHVDALRGDGPEFVRETHVGGLRVGTWVVDDEEGLRMLFEWEVDAVATNDPRLAISVRAGTDGRQPS